jgi:PAS domain S-box-containing protein
VSPTEKKASQAPPSRHEDAFAKISLEPAEPPNEDNKGNAAAEITLLKEAQEALRISDSRLRMATDAAELGIWSWDISEDHVIWENEWPYKFFGIPRSEGPINASRFKNEFIHADDVPQFEAAVLDVTINRRRFYFIGRLRRPTGEIRWVEFTGQPTADASGVTRMHGTATDVTARMAHQTALERSEARLRRVFESNVVGMIRWDLNRSLILEANKAFLEMTGYTRDDVVAGRVNFRSLTPPEWTERNEDGIRNIREKGFAAPYEKEYFRKDGSRIPLIIAGTRFDDSPAEGMSFLIDISERKRADAAMRQNAILFSTIIEQAPMGVYAVDAQFRLQQVNPEAMPIFANVHPLIGRDFNEVLEILWGPEVGRQCADIFRHTLETGERYISPRFAERRFDLGEEQTFEWQTQRVTLPDGQHGVVCYFHEVTERHRFEEALRAAKNAAEAANDSKDRFLAVLSHELRTPLTPILMSVTSLEQDSNLTSELREEMSMIKRNVELETKLIDDLLDLSRIKSGKIDLKLEPLDLNKVVRDVCVICQSDFDAKQISVETSLQENVSMISADPARLRQVLWNVLKNAIKFTPTAGTILVNTSRFDSNRCEIRVRDSGIGISPVALNRIFNAFEQGDTSITRKFGGLGLGLAISRALVELHGGTIRAESAGAGKGATFIVELPGMSPPSAQLGTVAPLTDEPQSRQIKLLLVEDHVDTARTLTRLLCLSGFVVITANDVASAKDRIEREDFDILISDLGLPDGDGYEIMRVARLRGNLRGIAMSGYGMEEDIQRSLDAGFTEHFVKPISVPQLTAAIRRMTEVQN